MYHLCIVPQQLPAKAIRRKCTHAYEGGALRCASHGQVQWDTVFSDCGRFQDVFSHGKLFGHEVLDLIVVMGDYQRRFFSIRIEEEPSVVIGVSECFDVPKDRHYRPTPAYGVQRRLWVEREIKLNGSHVSGSLFYAA